MAKENTLIFVGKYRGTATVIQRDVFCSTVVTKCRHNYNRFTFNYVKMVVKIVAEIKNIDLYISVKYFTT